MIFKKESKRVYTEIDKLSNLFWSLKDEFELYRNIDKSRSTRSRVSDSDKAQSKEWQKDTDAQLGYGEITRGAFSNLLMMFQNAGKIMS